MPDGTVQDVAKMVHIAQNINFYEQDYYTPSNDGFKVFPSMIENVISRHPAVHQCSVVGCTDKDHVQGRLPFVYVVLDPEGDKKKRQIVRELRQLCNEELPEYVQPVGYKFISEMPFTPVGKVDYRKLEEEITPSDY